MRHHRSITISKTAHKLSTAETKWLQIMQKLTASSNFLEDAKRAQRAYLHQIEMADHAVEGWLEKQLLGKGIKLEWICRPDPCKVEVVSRQDCDWDKHLCSSYASLLQ